MVGLKKLAKTFAAFVRSCSNMFITAGLALARVAANIEKFVASK